MLARARRSDRDRALKLCRSLPTRPTQIAAWIHDGGLDGQKKPGALFISPGEGLAFVSELGVVMPHLQERASIEALARWLGPLGARVVVGPSESASCLWSYLERRGVKARIRRDQVGYTVTRSGFLPCAQHKLNLRVAREKDLDAVVEASAAMAVEESRDDPARRNPTLFRRRITDRMRRGRDFVLFENRRLAFKVNVPALSPQGGHVEGVFVPEHARGRGLGLAGMEWVTRWILERAPIATLLVNADNTPARSMYEKLGFELAYESMTFLAH